MQSLSWAHGVFLGAAVESETTVAAIGKEGIIEHSPMANLDFLVVPLGVYIDNHLKFGNSLDKPPLIFSTNYFLAKNGKFLNTKLDKKAWLLWAEGRAHNEYDAIETPIGFIPKYEDLRSLFKQAFGKEYTKEEYTEQFTIRADRYLKKFDRIEAIYREETDVPGVFFKHVQEQRERLKHAQKKFGKENISPFDFE